MSKFAALITPRTTIRAYHRDEVTRHVDRERRKRLAMYIRRDSRRTGAANARRGMEMENTELSSGGCPRSVAGTSPKSATLCVLPESCLK